MCFFSDFNSGNGEPTNETDAVAIQTNSDDFNFSTIGGIYKTFSVRASACARTRAGAAIFVEIGAEIFSQMCVRVRA